MDAALDKRSSHHEDHEGHEGFGYYLIINFVLFVSFVVKFAFPFLVAAPRFVNSGPFAAAESVTSSPYSASLVRADLPVDVTRATLLHPRFLADSWVAQRYSRASRACPDLTVQR